jgi:cell wall-associated NlpC family hydrolase
VSRILRVTSTVLVAVSATPFPMHDVSAQPLYEQNTDGVVTPRANASLRNRVDTENGHLTTSGTIYAMANHRIVKISDTSTSVLKVLQNSVVKLPIQKSENLSVKRKAASTPRTKSSQVQASRSEPLSVGGTGVANRGVAIAKAALGLVGRPYRWGGASLAGFDCSGLIQYVYKQIGIYMPRTSYAQFTVGRAVPWNKLTSGDLVFFATDAKGASHVAIYVGNGLIVQALNSHTGVIVSHLNESYYKEHFIGAKRPF